MSLVLVHHPTHHEKRPRASGGMHPKPTEKPFAQVYIDLRVRTGITGYCPEGVLSRWKRAVRACQNKLIKADKCMSAADLLKNWREEPKIKRIRRRAQALRTKVRRGTCTQDHPFSVITLTPSFYKLDTVSLSAVGGRNISSETVRKKMMTFAHGSSRVFLKPMPRSESLFTLRSLHHQACTGCGFVKKSEAFHPSLRDAD
jgi:hypothetical protein